MNKDWRDANINNQTTWVYLTKFIQVTKCQNKDDHIGKTISCYNNSYSP